MNNLIYVYTDEIGVIHDIDFKLRGDLLPYTLSMIPREKAKDILDLYEKWQQNTNMKKNKFILVNNVDDYTIEKTIYIYYHFKDKNICSITPRKQEKLDNDEALRCGLIIVDSIIKEFIDGTKNMLNYNVNDSGTLLYIEEIIHKLAEDNFLENIPLLEDYIVGEDTVSYHIAITYDDKILKIKSVNKENKATYQLFFVSKTDKTKLYESVPFNFFEKSEIEIPLTVPDDYVVISSFKKVMKFDRI